MAYELSFAGVPFCLDTAKVVCLGQGQGEAPVPTKHQPMTDLVDELNKMLPFQYLQDFGLPGDYPGRDLSAIAYRSQIGPYPNPSIQIGDWYYPTTASRWSVFRGLATSLQVKEMVEAVNFKPVSFSVSSPFSSTVGTVPAEFVMHADPTITPTLTRSNDLAVNLLFGAQNPATKYRLSSLMYMLPPRPLAEHGSRFDGLYLVTLVDERYFYQYSPVSLKVTKGTTWNNLVEQCGNALGTVIGFVDIPGVFGAPEPDSHLWSTMENATILLDAIAYNVGDVIVRLLDGSLKFLYTYESQTIAKANRGAASQVLRLAGGEIFNSGILYEGNLRNLPRNQPIPEFVNVTYPKYVIGDDPVPHFLNARYLNPRPTCWFEESFGEDFTVTVPLLSGNEVFEQNVLLRDFFPMSGITGVPGYAHTIHNTAKAIYSGERQAFTEEPLNVSGLISLSMELASNWWDWQTMEALDEIYPGTYQWIPEGYHDIIWTYSARAGRACTRVMKTQWNQGVKEMQHSTPPPAQFQSLITAGPEEGRPDGPWIPAGVGGPSVAQTIRDKFANDLEEDPDVEDEFFYPIATLLDGTLTAASHTATFNNVAYFPTQNRWRGRIEDEIILFEGTSGGIRMSPGLPYEVTIVYRGIDGTLVKQHAAGTQVRQLGPNLAYGVNLTTYEKAQFLYPAEWTSGGIQGANIVPQTQSVLAIEGTGVLINKIRHYSGSVSTYDWTKTSGFEWAFEEACWLVERNTRAIASGQIYDGQFVGYSNDEPLGKTAPIYAVNADLGGTSTPNCRTRGLRVFGNPLSQIPTGVEDPCPLELQLLTQGLEGDANTIKFNACDFITRLEDESAVCPGLYETTVQTRGLTTTVPYLDPDCNPRFLVFRDGLLQSI